MPAIRLVLTVLAVAALAAPLGAESSAAPMRVSAQVVRTCRVAAVATHAAVRCSARGVQTVRVQVDQNAPALHRVSTVTEVPADLRNARRLTINF